MKIEEYIQCKLEEIKNGFSPQIMSQPVQIIAEIFKLLMSKKFRKYSVCLEYQEHIQRAIHSSVKQQKPISLVLPFGGYKLWRLPEAPTVDWAELFALIYYSNWLKPVCEIYEPGVVVDFFADDIIIPRLNNIDESAVVLYRESFLKLIKFIDQYLPANLGFTYNRVADQYSSERKFEADLQNQIAKQKDEMQGKLPILDDRQKARIELNVRLTDKQAADPLWREKVELIRLAYMKVEKKMPYYWTEGKIVIRADSAIPRSIPVGTTKHSIVKYWCGAGALEKNGEGYNQLIMSPQQLEQNRFKNEKVRIHLLEGHNFTNIRVKSSQVQRS